MSRNIQHSSNFIDGFSDIQTQLRALRNHFGIAGLLLGFGLFWSIAGVLLTPSMKLFDWLLTAFVYLPSIYLLIKRFGDFRDTVQGRHELWLFLLLFCWSVISLSWSVTGENYLTLIKRELLFLSLVLGWIVWGRMFNRQLQSLLIIWGAMAGVYALVSIIAFPMRGLSRMYGFGSYMDNPNPAGYTIGFLLVLSCTWWPQRMWARLAWAALQACSLSFVIMTGSRGPLLSLVAVAGVVMLAGGRPLYRTLAVVLVIAAGFLFLLEPSLLQRGDSERLALIKSAVELTAQHPWLGIGLGASYAVSAGGVIFDHCHNFVLDTTLQYGVIFTALWVFLWGWVGLRAWRCRDQALGMAVLLAWVFASVALQFDVFVLFGRARAMWMVVWVPFLLSLCLSRTPVSERTLSNRL
ncbi:O-antigen ligase family protein [Pseudomonas sp. 10B1]|uniref:O-antigen ligase family protein n=1 Tax=unclassified Pseudomonas TaxID=196821 RepID=UPI002AB3D2F2|nr:MULTISPECIES: O-antigen ligase family protein [unclassified Pseudomonas]MDY7563076.1 O-antigen ligase family protein [Pseudomonas sp. AB6]MEA9993840.1 O-antigen ligase family protein [Pseudomonas sp. AA4]MEB0085181.1 O-antigen ligase family protein [Pseudomonas sp. RTI1]MEB0125284.1 O-antigen ligase family protein [Pseudomonas sp. CCC1.2]MEB0152175.1 O-antigen ligase family protein [Pseudomonas sp. CCC4.3]